MVEPSPSGRGRRKPRGKSSYSNRRKQKARGQGRGRGRRPHGNQGQRGRKPPSGLPDPEKDKDSILGGRKPDNRSRLDSSINAFNLFCAYYLGITADDSYKRPNLDAVVRRFGITQEEIDKYLEEFQLDSETVKKSPFDMEGAQLDIRLAPMGISRIETARGLFEEYAEATGLPTPDWVKDR